MSGKRPGRTARLRLAIRSRRVPLAVAAVLAIGFLIWVVPRRVDLLVSADGKQVWDASTSSARQVVWGEPRPIEGLIPDVSGSSSTPFLCDGGATLWFSHRPRDGQARLHRSRFLDGQWQPAETIFESDGDHEDIGPVVSHDGRQLYFSSNRPGGLGGFDLYVADRVGSGWSKPRNLGPAINGPADERSPSLSPDGLSLYLASNRPAQFDLYVSRRASVDADWSPLESLDDLNTSASETTPRLSPSGRHLWFASDRGKKGDLDLYRCRLVEGRFVEVEGVGSAINTAGDETAPALSPEGFTLVYSGDGVLLISTAQEVHSRTGWNTSNAQALGLVWRQLLLMIVLLSGLTTAAIHYRARLMRTAGAARWIAASLAIHALLLLGFWGVPLARTIAEKAEEIRISELSPQRIPDQIEQPDEDRRPSFEKPADLKPHEPVPLPREIRRAVAQPDAPDRFENLAPTIPLDAARTLPTERLLLVPMKTPEILLGAGELPRRAGIPRTPAAVDVPVAPIPVEAAPTEKPLDERPIAQTRRDPLAPMPIDLPRRELPTVSTKPAVIDVNPSLAPQPEVAGPSPLRERTRTSRLPAPAPIDEPLVTTPAPTTTPTVEKPTTVVLPRTGTLPPDAPDRTPPRTTAPVVVDRPGPTVGGDRPHGDMPVLTPIVGRTGRAPASGSRIATVEDRGGDPGAYSLRQDDVRKEAIEALGGSKESEAAVERGLDWLAAHQSREGNWSLNNFQANCKHPACTAAAGVTSDTGGTGLALLPFLAAGHTHKAGKHQQTVARGLKWLKDQQRADGGWLGQGDAKMMYGHALASIALCEAFGMTQDPTFRVPAQKALDFIVKAQHAPSGGWRYAVNTSGDTSVVGWQVMALKSGQMAGLTVPPQTLEGAKRWLKSVEAATPGGGQFGYLNNTPTPAMTAQGLLCLQLMGTNRADPRLQAGAEHLLKHLPKPNVETSYYWYHATQVMHHMQGKYWKTWNEKIRDLLVSTQIKTGPMAGSWDPIDPREKTGGRICSTALRLLMLEVYYRHLPLYRQLDK